MVPEEWKSDHVGNSLNICNNLRKPISLEERGKIPGKFPYYGPTRIQSYISSYEQDGKFALIGEDGDHFLKFSNVSQTQIVQGKCTVNNHAHIVSETDICTVEWFANYFQHRDITKFLTRQGAARYKLNKAALEQLPILLPPLSEQKKIAEILSTWDRAIEVTERQLENAKTQKKALMQQLLTGKRRLPGFDGEWKMVKLGDVFVRVSRKNTSGNDNVLTISGQDGLISQRDYFGKRVAASDLSKYTLLKTGDFAYNKSYSKGYPMGAIKPLVLYPEGVVSSLYICFTQAETRSTCNDFYRHYFEAGQLNRQLMGITQEGARNHGLLNLAIADFFSIKIPRPNLSEQKAISSVIEVSENTVRNEQRRLHDLRTEKRALMQQLLTGKKRVKA